MEQQSRYFDPAARWVNARNIQTGQAGSNVPVHHSAELHQNLLPMDDFDRALLAEPMEPCPPALPDAWPAMQLYRPPVSREHNTAAERTTPGEVQNTIRLHSSSSSSSFPISSPTITALHQRQQMQPPLPMRDVIEQPQTPRHEFTAITRPSCPASQPPRLSVRLGHAPPIIQGIPLIETSHLPDHFRSLFKYPFFNAVQSKCFGHAYEGNDNIVLSAPTGSGKTVVMELAICRLLLDRKNEDVKVVYQAPTKSLCAERCRDWSAKFRSLGLQCAELTGDIESVNLKNVQQANVIIATPEKWDSVTRKWKDNAKLVQMIKLFLVDEVHILRETRGATLEAIVSRMKSVGTGVRFVALSATIPNSEDVATWLGLNMSSQHLPAVHEVFGESFRPTELEKHVIGYKSPPNDFILDNMLVKELPAVIARYSKRKPVMIFCPTQKSAAKTARSLADLWLASSDQARLWPTAAAHVKVIDPELQKLTDTAVAYHHGGMDVADRQAVERGFFNGNISIICSTSTLAVGVNLPCYLVILKGTSCYADSGLQEYSILETMQMLGRAGRPQFETSACAVIMTSKDRVSRYEKLIAGQDVLESSLHENLIEHLNAEIGVGTIVDVSSARKWLRSTFLYVRVSRNPGYYKLAEFNQNGDDNEDEILDALCKKALQILEAAQLIEMDRGYRCTEFGQAMSRYYVKFDTMKSLMALPPKARQSEILDALTQAVEFKDLRWKTGEKGLYKKMNKSNEIRYPIKADVSLSAHKASLAIQAALGGYMLEKDDMKFNLQLQQDMRMALLHANRLIRCVIDIHLSQEDATSARHALELGRSLAAKVWDDTPMQLKQIEGIGDVTARKFASHGITSVEALSSTDSHKIELILGKNPPFGSKLLQRLQQFPNLLVTVKQSSQKRIASNKVEVRMQCEIGTLNNKVNPYFNKKAVYICFLCELASGRLIDFRRFSAARFLQAREFTVTVLLDRPASKVACHVMCDEIAGTYRYAEVKLETPTSWFRRSCTAEVKPSVGSVLHEEFDDADVIDEDFLNAETTSKIGSQSIDDIDNVLPALDRNVEHHAPSKRKANVLEASEERRQQKDSVQLPNGNWTCQHTCVKEKKACKHSCCTEGVKKPKKRPKTGSLIAVPEQGRPSSKKSNERAGSAFKNNIIESKSEEQQDERCEASSTKCTETTASNDVNMTKAKDGAELDWHDISSDSLPDVDQALNRSKSSCTVHPIAVQGRKTIAVFDEEEYECFDLADCDWNTCLDEIRPCSPHIAKASVVSTSDNPSSNTDNPLLRMNGSSSSTDTFISTKHAMLDSSTNEDIDHWTSSSDDMQSHDTMLHAGEMPNGIAPNECFSSASNSRQVDTRPVTITDEKQRKQNQHDEDQKRKWAAFEPWMYEQFGSHVDII